MTALLEYFDNFVLHHYFREVSEVITTNPDNDVNGQKSNTCILLTYLAIFEVDNIKVHLYGIHWFIKHREGIG